MLLYKDDKGSTSLIFASGKIVIVGSKSELQLLDSVISLGAKLKKFEVIQPNNIDHDVSFSADKSQNKKS
jgi:TATA-box binding protein (TBP) (component of TFIID and TFIIIB)